MATTLFQRDYLGRELQNEDPGETDPALDFIGREVTATADYMGRALTDEFDDNGNGGGD